MIMRMKAREAFRNFSNIASPFLNIKDETHYLEAIELIKDLMQES